MTSTQLSVRCRPRRLDDVVGQPAAVAYVRGMMKRGSAPNLMLISGPYGTGKTTLARIIGALLSGWRGDPDENPDLRDFPANVDRTIDDVRGLIEFSKYRPRGGKRRVIVVDEAQGLVGPAAGALLKATEDPPPHVTWIFCSSDPHKMNRAQLTRAQSIALRPVEEGDIVVILQNVARSARIRVGERLLERIAASAHGSPRQAVQLLEAVHTSMEGGADARSALQLAVESNSVVDGLDAATAYLSAVMAGRAREAVCALGSGTGDGMVELVNTCLGCLVRAAAGMRPRPGLDWVVTKKIRTRSEDLSALLDLQARLVAAMQMRSTYFVPSDSILFALARGSSRETR